MSLITDARGWVQNAFRSSPKNLPSSSLAIALRDQGRKGKSNVRMFRNWSEHGEWVRTAINIRKSQVSQSEWEIQPVDDAKPFSEELAARITALLMEPNPKDDSFRGFIEPVVEDIVVLDAGCIEKEFTLRGQIGALWPVDGGTIKVSTIWDGDPDEPRYFWYPDYQERARYLSSEMVYMMMNPATYRVVGLSPLETLKIVIDSELGISDVTDRNFRQAAPDGLLDLGEGARSEQVDEFKQYWLAEVAGKGMMAFIGGTKNAKFHQFRPSNRESMTLEWQMYLTRKIAGVFGLSPQDLGITFDVNRSTSEVQQENTEDRGLRPLLGIVQDYITREVVQDQGFGGPANNLAFVFTRLSVKESESRARVNKLALAGMPWKTVDEARKDDGRPPIGGVLGRSLIAMAPKGPVLLTEDDIPTAREALMAGSKPATPGGGSPAAKADSTEPGLVPVGDF